MSDAVMGIVIIAGAMSLLTFLVLWGRRSINKIAEKGYRSAREIIKENNGDV